MELKLAQIITDDFLNGITKLSKGDLPMKTAFKLKDVTSEVKEQTLKYQEVVKDLFDKYGKKDKDGKLKHSTKQGVVQVQLDDQEKFNKAHLELLDITVEFDTVEVKFDDLGDLKMSPNELEAISKVINFVD